MREREQPNLWVQLGHFSRGFLIAPPPVVQEGADHGKDEQRCNDGAGSHGRGGRRGAARGGLRAAVGRSRFDIFSRHVRRIRQAVEILHRSNA